MTVKVWKIIPDMLVPRFREYFRVGKFVGWCALRTPWFVVMVVS